MSLLDDALGYGRACIGAVYGWWGGGPIEDWDPMYGNAPGLTPQYVLSTSVNCSGLINAMRNMSTGDASEAIGGTLAYGDYVTGNWDYFDPSRWYKVGTLLLEPFGGGSEGHIVILSHPGQWVLQANTARGCDEGVQAWYQHQWTPFTYAFWMPGFPSSDTYPGGADGSTLSVAGYPGDVGTWQGWADWMTRVAREVYGLPGILPVLCSVEEWRGVSYSDESMDMSQIAGFNYAVDFDSILWFQQRLVYYPNDNASSELALRYFLDRALETAPSGPPYPTDKDSICEWIYNIQNSGDPSWWAEHWDRAYQLAGPEPNAGPTPTPPPKEDVLVFEPYNFVAPSGEGSERAYAWAAGAALNSFGKQTLTITDDQNAKAAHDAAGKDAKIRTYDIGPGDDVVTLRGLRRQILSDVAVREGLDKDKLVSTFDDILLATNPEKFGPLLDEAKKDGPMPDPPPPPPAPDHWKERGWVQTNFQDEKRLRFVPEGSSYADPWGELVKVEEIEEDDLVLVWRSK